MGYLCSVKLTVRNMVCPRCIAAVQRVFEAEGLVPTRVALGEVEVQEDLNDVRTAALSDALEQAGFGLVTDGEARTVTAIKTAVVQLVHAAAADRVKLSEHLSEQLHRDYSGLSALFSQQEGITIEQYFLQQRIERVKELLQYGELTVSEIAFQVGFSSVAHLSAQFKQLTGMTPTEFKQRGERRTLDAV